MIIPDREPTEDEVLQSLTGMAKLSLFFIRQNADKVESHVKNGLCHIRLHYVH